MAKVINSNKPTVASVKKKVRTALERFIGEPLEEEQMEELHKTFSIWLDGWAAELRDKSMYIYPPRQYICIDFIVED